MLLGVSSGWRNLDRQLYLARKAIADNNNQQASLAFAQAAERVPWRNDLWEQAGIYALQAGEYQLAKTHFERVESESELTYQGLIASGDIAHHEGDLPTAIEYWEQALTTQQKYDLHFRLADAYYQLGDLDNSIHHQTALVDLNPTDSNTNYQLGLMLAAWQPEAALAYLSHAAELDSNLSAKTNELVRNVRSARSSDDPSYLYVSAGQALASIEEWALAETALFKATQLNPEYAEAWAYLGEARQQIGKDGLADLEKGLTIDPQSIAANTLMGLYWQRQECYDLALVYLHSAAKLNELNPTLQAEIGNTLGLLGNLTSAESHYRRAVDLSPRDPTYWQILANFYIKFENKLDEDGLAAARQAVILDPTDPASLDAMAQVYLLLESPHIARRFLERAIASESEYAPAHLHMGLIHIIEGDSLRAFQQFTLAKNLSAAGSPTAEQADRLLKTHFP